MTSKVGKILNFIVDTSFELHGGSKETKIPKKRWYVAHVLYVFKLYIFWGVQKGIQKGLQKGVQKGG